MADAHLVITDANGNGDAVGRLFEGLNFFLVQRVPARLRFVADIEANGGRVVKSEAKADYLIADHMRADAPGGSFSYTFIEAAIRDGQLPNPGDHATGRRPGSVREVASASIPAKGTRTAFTLEDDRILWQWVEREKAQGGTVKGNEIYKRLEAANPRHTFQAWRDRYIKKLMNRPPAGVHDSAADDAPPSPATTASGLREAISPESARGERRRSPQKRRMILDVRQDDRDSVMLSTQGDEQTKIDIELLMGEANDIETIEEDREDEAWGNFAAAYPQRTARGWREFYLAAVQPLLRVQNSSEAPADLPFANSPDIGSLPVDDHNQGSKRKRFTSPDGRTGPTCSMQSPQRRKFKRLENFNPTPGLSHVSAKVSRGKEVLQINSSQESEESTETDGDATADFRNSDGGIITELQTVAVLDPIVTSEANYAAGLQLQATFARETEEVGDDMATRDDALGALDEQYQQLPHRPDDIDTPSSIPDQDEDFQGQGTVRPPFKRASRDMFGRSRSETPSSSVAAAVEEKNRAEAHSVAIETAGFALTEANLAAQEERLKTRGQDLPEDDETKSQGSYMRYLQQILPMDVPVTYTYGDEEEEEDAEEEGHEYGDEQMKSMTRPFSGSGALATGQDNFRRLAMSDPFQVSSQEEVDHVLDSNLQWPMSPQQQRRHGTERESRAFESQVRDSNRQSQDSVIEDQSQSRYLLSRIAGTPSPSPDPSGVAARQPQPANEVSSPFPRSSQLEYAADMSNDQDVLDSARSGSFENDDIDLTIPEPEGGFNFSPSPDQTRRLDTQFEPEERQEDRFTTVLVAMEATPKKTSPRGPVLISSTSPVSSSPDSSARFTHFSEPHSREAPRPSHAIETQDIYNAKTQLPDLGVPDPSVWDDDSQDDHESTKPDPADHAQYVSSPSLHPQAALTARDLALESDDASNDRSDVNSDEAHSHKNDAMELDDWMAMMKVRGHEEASVIKSLKCTSMRTELAHLVLISIKAGQGLPEDVPGVWSETEDSMLESGSARGLRGLEAKHGWDECEARLQYLDEWRHA